MFNAICNNDQNCKIPALKLISYNVQSFEPEGISLCFLLLLLLLCFYSIILIILSSLCATLTDGGNAFTPASLVWAA